MKVFNCKITGKEVFSDAYKFELVDDLYYQVYGTYKASDYSVDDSLIGGNKSAEDTDAGGDNANNIVVEPDVVTGSKLEEIDHIISSKKEFKSNFRKIGPQIIKYAKEEIEDSEKLDAIKKGLQAFGESVLKEWDQYRFFATEGDGFELSGSLIFFKYPDKERTEVSGAKYHLYVFKYGLEEEKC